MDVLLTHAYYMYEDPAEREIMKPYPPLGLLYIASYLRSRNVDVGVIDSTFLSREEHLKAIAATEAPVVGIYVNLMTRKNVFQIIEAAHAGGSKVVLGGPEPVNYAAEYFERGADIIVAGEGEHTMAELLPVLAQTGELQLHDVAGILFPGKDGQIETTPPREQLKQLDELPFPARDCIDMQRYLDTWKTHHGDSAVSIITARGCPYTCRWCSHSVYGFTYRRRSPQDVASELEMIRNTLDPDRIWYADDVFAMSRHWLRSFADELTKRGLHFPFETISREDRLDEEVIKLLAQMGCYRLWVGAESGSQRVLDRMDRRTDAKRMRDIMLLLQKHGIRAGTFIMLGYDGEEWQDIDETTEHLCATQPDDVLTTIAYPIKGTPYYEDVAHNVVAKADWAVSSDRNLTVAGRYSARFYQHAQHWIHARVQLAKSMRDEQRSLVRITRLYLNTQRHRAAMYLTRSEREPARVE